MESWRRTETGAKSALETLRRYFAVTLAPRGITVNTISPGWIEDSVLNTLPDRRLGTPADIGNAVTLLCSNEAGWMTGSSSPWTAGWG